jgi:hypothetical protein
MSTTFVLIAGHIVNLQQCNYVELDGSTICIRYPEDDLELELGSETEAAQAMVTIAQALETKGLLVNTAQSK